MLSHCAEKAPTPAAAVATAAPRAANARAPGVDRNRRAAESMADGIAQQLLGAISHQRTFPRDVRHFDEVLLNVT